MAGAVFVSNVLRLPLTTQQFDHVVDRIRASLDAGSDGVARSIFEPLDDGGMSFISAAELDAQGLRAFHLAVDRARAEAVNDGAQRPFVRLWDELLQLIRQDPRSLRADTA